MLEVLEMVERSAVISSMKRISIDATYDKAMSSDSLLCASRRTPEGREINRLRRLDDRRYGGDYPL